MNNTKTICFTAPSAVGLFMSVALKTSVFATPEFGA